MKGLLVYRKTTIVGRDVLFYGISTCLAMFLMYIATLNAGYLLQILFMLVGAFLVSIPTLILKAEIVEVGRKPEEVKRATIAEAMDCFSDSTKQEVKSDEPAEGTGDKKVP